MAQSTQETQNWSDACLFAAQAATQCADWCIQNDADERGDCIRNCLDTAVLCTAAARLTARESSYFTKVLGAVAAATRACADECSSHAGDHESMDRCATACNEAADALEGFIDSQR